MMQLPSHRHSNVFWVVMVALLTVIMLPGPALARQATVNWTSYVRVGPGYQYGVLDQIDAETKVDVQDCMQGWCRVVYPGRDGYVEEALFTAPNIHVRPSQSPPTGPCFDARVNGYLAHGEAIRVCGK